MIPRCVVCRAKCDRVREFCVLLSVLVSCHDRRVCPRAVKARRGVMIERSNTDLDDGDHDEDKLTHLNIGRDPTPLALSSAAENTRGPLPSATITASRTFSIMGRGGSRTSNMQHRTYAGKRMTTAFRA